ncbi:MAG: arginase family protein, partial [Bdellovibrionota bacterium]
MTASLFGCKKGSSEKIVVLGLGFDQGSTTHPGCKMAPQILRNFSNSLGLSQGYLWNLSKQRKDFEDLSLSDLGDLNYKAHQPRESYFASIRKTIETLTSRQKIPLLLGGDHLASLPVLEAMAGLHSKFQVVQIDAHTDCQRVADGDQPTHANFIRFALNEKPIKKIIQIGVRGYCREVPDFPNHLIQSLPQNLRHHLLPSVPDYLSIDMDGFDPAIAPAEGHHILGGLQFSDL